MAPDTRPELDAEGRYLLASLEECNAKQMDAVDQLSHPRTMMTYPAYVKAADALSVMRLKGRQILQRLRAHRKKLRDR
jgi:hypothetical protein